MEMSLWLRNLSWFINDLLTSLQNLSMFVEDTHFLSIILIYSNPKIARNIIWYDVKSDIFSKYRRIVR
jgi:hypothetical protein